MRAIILSAGQGRRLMPLTVEMPKCLLSIHGKTLVEWQIEALCECGVEEIIVVTGYHAEKVDEVILQAYGRGRIKTLYNPVYAVTDNMVSCWAARHEMKEDFIILNGDTLFEAAVLKRLLVSPEHPVTVVIDHKEIYDTDDMKVELDGARLVRIGKNIAPARAHGESIGMILFRGEGPLQFCETLGRILSDPTSGKKWYLSAIDEMAQVMPVWTCSINGLKWCEVDYLADLVKADEVVSVSTIEADNSAGHG